MSSNRRRTRRQAPSRRVPLPIVLAGALALALGALASACAAGDDVAPAIPEATEAAGAPVADATTAAALDPATAASSDTLVAPDLPDAEGASGTSDSTAVPDALAGLAGVEAVTIVESWDTFSDVEAVEAAIARNLGVGENTMELALAGAPATAGGLGAALELTYDIGAAAPHDFVGFNRSFDLPADWSGASAVAMWVDETADAGVNVVFQFRERSGEVWRYEGPMPTASDGAPLRLPLDLETFAWANWSTEENGAIDLDAVDQYGVYVGHAGPGRSGVVTLGPIVVVVE